MQKIVFFEGEDWEQLLIDTSLQKYPVLFRKDVLSDEIVNEIQDATIISTFLYSSLSKEILSKLPFLKLIITRSVGFDHIDLDFCREKGITVCNVPTYGIETVAEHVFALILALSRKIVWSVERTRKGNFSLDGLRGIELAGKTLGVIGAGHIGSRVIEIGRAFGMKVLVYTAHKENLGDLYKKMAVVSLDDLLSVSDIITIHAPLTEETRHMINMQNVEKIKKGCMLINTARGGLIETQALLDGLEKGIFSGAGLDVLEEECFLREETELLTTRFLEKCDLKTQLLDHILLQREDVVVTPHNAFNTDEALARIMKTTIENITAYIAGKAQNVVA